MPKFVIEGGNSLKGEVKISGSKNAALPILAATLLTDQLCTIKNVPDIEDIHAMISILRSLGSEVEFNFNTVKIQTKHIRQGNAPNSLGCKMRASVLLLGPLLARTGRAYLSYPGGCVLGARPINTHIDVMRQLGVKKMESLKSEIKFYGKPVECEVIMPEFSVTATENAIMAASLSSKPVNVRLTAVEPHVQDLCRFLVKLGVRVEGIGTHMLTVVGPKKSKGAVYSITPDYLETGTFVVASIITRGDVTIKNIVPHDMDAFWNLLKEMGIFCELNKDSVYIKPVRSFMGCKRLQTNVFPGFPTDLQPPFVVLLTQAKGASRVHETLFEGRFNYFPELKKMGAKIKKINPHEAIVDGPVLLKGTRVNSWDIRAGAAMIIAALAAKGTTLVSNIQYIDRGYENFDGKLRQLGANIERIE